MILVVMTLNWSLPELNKKCNSSFYFSLANLAQIQNATTRASIQADLNQDKDSSRTLIDIDVASAKDLFTIFGLKDPGCDKNANGRVDGD